MLNIPNEDNKGLYICANKCPELDRFCMPHCKTTFKEDRKCPCGKQPVWIPLEECNK